MTTPPPRLYATGAELRRTLRIAYPAGAGRIVLATEADWDARLQPAAVSDDGTVYTFELRAHQPYLYFKPCLLEGKSTRWSVGSNYLALMGEDDDRPYYPHFSGSDKGHFTDLIEMPSKLLGRPHRLRVYLPPGYAENTLAAYPVVYMQDGQNLFFPEEAFLGRDWDVEQTSQTLNAMRAVEEMIIVGLYSADRVREYTRPGYEAYARALVEEVVPAERRLLRGARHRRFRTVWGSSLGGVVSFFTAWQHADVFGSAACMSGTFSHQDDLLERVLAEPRRDVAFYLDSGWPGDNYEVTMAMATALIARGWRYGHDVFHLCFPRAAHDEGAWGVRLHLPMQFFYGAVARASRILAPVITGPPDRPPGLISANPR
jgi:predicted alpha/beta superfamily hydrolase